MMLHVPSAHEVETFSGSWVDTHAPNPKTIRLEDIAHALANTCRYGGHCSKFYSVAEHAVFCSIRVERQGYGRNVCLAALHHDDAEAYLGDIPRPLKPLLGQVYTDLSDRMDEAIVEGLGLPFGVEVFHDFSVKLADEWALLVEARDLLPSKGKTWTAIQPGINGQPKAVVVPDYWLGGIDPKSAEGLFLSRHWSLLS